MKKYEKTAQVPISYRTNGFVTNRTSKPRPRNPDIRVGPSNLVTRMGLFDQLSKDSSPNLELAGIATGAHTKPP
jgi:hypothetical protein